MTRRPAAAAAGAAVLVALLALLPGCTGSAPTGPPASTTADQPSSGTAPPPGAATDGTSPAPGLDGSSADDGGATESGADAPSPEVSLTIDARVGSGSVALDHTSTSDLATATAVPDGDSGAVLTLTVPDPTTVVLLEVPEAAGGTARRAPDRSAAVVRVDGGLALGAAAPRTTGADGTSPPVRWDAADDGGPRLELALGAVDEGAFPLEVTTHLGTSVVASTSWGDREGGRSLAVTPTDWGRVSGATGSAFAWGDLLAQDPTADTPGMDTQLQCHLVGARDKSTWNLEPWRPDLSLVEYALARCNPS